MTRLESRSAFTLACIAACLMIAARGWLFGFALCDEAQLAATIDGGVDGLQLQRLAAPIPWQWPTIARACGEEKPLGAHAVLKFSLVEKRAVPSHVTGNGRTSTQCRGHLVAADNTT